MHRRELPPVPEEAENLLLIRIFQGMWRHQLDETIRFLRNPLPGRSRSRLIVFTRLPQPGHTKTRLIPVLGPEGAADLHRRMTEHTLRKVRQFVASRPVSVQIQCRGGSGPELRQWLGGDLRLRPQAQGDLGRRMALAFTESFEGGMRRVVLIGTDIPGIRTTHLARAFLSLRRKDLVIGPASDGGYYLIGLRRPHPELFEGIPWGAGEVLEKTLAVAAAGGLSVKLLDCLDDVDRPEDIRVWEREVRNEGLSDEPESLSIVMPMLDEADAIESALRGTEAAPSVKERIVVDGGSSDGSAEMARACGARVILTPSGRSLQMNAGAGEARAEILLFLHADTRLPPGFEHHVQEVLARPGAIAGAFRLGIDGPGPGLRVIEWLANLRSAFLGMPYGDQAIFLRADRFVRTGGFPEMPIMEDFALMRRLRREGRIGMASVAVATSARRYREWGLWRATWINQIMILGYLLGVSPNRLAKWYRSGPTVTLPAGPGRRRS